MRIIFSLAIIAIILVSSCDDKPCYEDTNTYFRIGFYQVKDDKVQDTILDSLVIHAPKSNFGLLYRNAKTIYPELSPHNDTTLFYLSLNNNNGDDYFQLAYEREYHLISHDCGFVVNFKNLKVIESSAYFIDSVVVTNETVNNVNTEHIKIYL